MSGFELIVCDACGDDHDVRVWIPSPPARERVYLCEPCRTFWDSPEGFAELRRAVRERGDAQP